MFSQYKGLRKELYVLFIGRIMTNLGSMIWPMLTLILNKKLGMNASEVANCLLAFSILSLPVSLLGGKLTDRLNKRNIIVVCDLVSVICYVVCGLIPLTFFSIVLLALAALFQTVEWPAYDALVADITLPKDRVRAYSLNYFGSNLGLMLAPTIGGLLFNDHLDIAFIINGLAILLSTALIFFFIKDISREKSDEDVNEYEDELDGNTNAFRYIISNRTLIIYLLVIVFYHTIYNQFSFLMPLELGAQYGDKGSVIYGTLSSANCLTVVLLTTVLTRILAKVTDVRKLLLGIVFVLMGLIIFKVFLRYPFFIYVGIVVFTIGEIIDSLGSGPYVSKRIPANYRGRITSIYNVIGSIGISLYTKVVGFIYDGKGPSSAWIFVFVCGMIAIGICLHLMNIDRKDYPNLYK